VLFVVIYYRLISFGVDVGVENMVVSYDTGSSLKSSERLVKKS